AQHISGRYPTLINEPSPPPSEPSSSSSSPVLVPEQRKGITASEWIRQKLYWHRDNQSAFRVSINRPNFYVRMLCGLACCPDVVLTSDHLKQAKLVLDRFQGIIILEDEESHSFLKRYGYPNDKMPKVLGKGSMESAAAAATAAGTTIAQPNDSS